MIEDIDNYDILRYWRPYQDTSGVCNAVGESPSQSWRRKEFTLHRYHDEEHRWGIEYHVPEECSFGSEAKTLPEAFEAAKAFIPVVTEFVAGLVPKQHPLTPTSFGSFCVDTKSDHEGVWLGDEVEYIVTVMSSHPPENIAKVSGTVSLPKEDAVAAGVRILDSLLEAFSSVYP
ncbi:MAG: hypothetical protein LAT68_16070 [Cyclobacteriaceae bacterium]|nr:hypothetical protein [Cyclobacteriaceae bacterium]